MWMARNSIRQRFSLTVSGLMLIAVFCMINAPAYAIIGPQLITVDTTNDTADANPSDRVCNDGTGACSLRAAVQTASYLSGLITIQLPGGTFELTITGAGEQFGATGDLDVIVPSQSTISISGSTSATSPTIIQGASGWDDRIFEVANGSVSFSNLIIRGGNVADIGGGIKASNTSSVYLSNCQISNNSSTGNGGGIAASGPVFSMDNCRIDNNASGANGGGIYALAVNTTIRSSTFDNNSATNGAGVHADSATGLVDIVNSTLSGNIAQQNGGGLFAMRNVSLYSVTIADNMAAASGTIGYGGGIYLFSSTSIRNSIVSGNHASYFVLTNVDSPDCYSPDPTTSFLGSQGYNLIGDMTRCAMDAIAGDQLGTGTTPIDAKLGALQNNGGVTPTHALLAGSPAIDAGNPNGCVDQTAIALTEDQRGNIRVVDGDGDGAAVCDIGSVEVATIVSGDSGSDGGGGSLDWMLLLILTLYFSMAWQRETE